MSVYSGRTRAPEDDDATAPAATLSNDDRPPVVPRFRSRFGGLWTDLSIAHDLIAGKRALGRVSDAEAELLSRFVDEGYVILEGAVPHALVDAVRADLEATLDGRLVPRDAEWWTAEGKRHGRATPLVMREEAGKMLDLHFTSHATQSMIFAPPIARFLELVFERPPLAFQSLTFVYGSRQPVHQDTAFVRVSSALEFVACWVALEDIEPGSGELEYYPGSHAMPEELFEGRSKWVPAGTTVVPDYSGRLHERARAAGLALTRFLPKKGDALVWAADLVHGGARDVEPGRTRRSHVTHYCPVDRSPMYLAGAGEERKLPSVNGGFVCEDRRA